MLQCLKDMSLKKARVTFNFKALRLLLAAAASSQLSYEAVHSPTLSPGHNLRKGIQNILLAQNFCAYVSLYVKLSLFSRIGF